MNEDAKPGHAQGHDATIEACAKIADPWPGFWPLDEATPTDLAIIEVRKKIAAAIRASNAVPSTHTTSKPRCALYPIISDYYDEDAEGRWRKCAEHIASAVSQTSTTCQKCGSALGGEAAQVGNAVWCHPCADDAPESQTVRGQS